MFSHKTTFQRPLIWNIVSIFASYIMYAMKILTKIFVIAILCMGGIGMVSCISSEESSSKKADNNCAIKEVTLGGLPRLIKTTSTVTGKDTSYYVTVAGSSYRMYIDQMTMEIYNPDSLPLNTRADKVVFTAVTGDGTIFYRNAAGKDTIFASKDTIDFTEPRYFTCYSTDGTQSKTYRVSVNVHKSASEQFTWTEACAAADAFEGVSEQKAFVQNGCLVVMAVKDGKPMVITASMSAPDQWTVAPVSGLAALEPSKVLMYGNSLYYVDGTLKQSADGQQWTTLDTDTPLDYLLAMNNDVVYAVGAGKVYSSSDLQAWTEEALGGDASQLPVSNLATEWSQMSFNSNFTTIMAAGHDAEGNPVVWKKTLDATGCNSDKWENYPLSDEVRYAYPALEQSVMFCYDSNVYYLGLAGNRVSNFYISSDGGRNWILQSSANYAHPYTDVEAESFAVALDADNYFWMIFAPSGKVVKGRLNRLGFDSNQTLFLKGSN